MYYVTGPELDYPEPKEDNDSVSNCCIPNLNSDEILNVLSREDVPMYIFVPSSTKTRVMKTHFLEFILRPRR